MRYNLSNPIEASKAKVYLASLIKESAKSVEITKKKKRTLSQNGLFWMWMRCFSDVIGEENVERCKTMVVRKLLGQQIIENRFTGKTEYYDFETSKFGTDDMKNLLDRFHAWASAEFGMHLPLPEEQGYDDMYNAYAE